jgi:hypothetical protein
VTVTPNDSYCAHHTSLAGEEAGSTGTPKKRRPLRVVGIESAEREQSVSVSGNVADPATIRPRLARAAAENVEQLQASLLEAAGSAVRPVWITVECEGCGRRSRVEAPVPDVRARVSAIELLLSQGLGRVATSEQLPTVRMPESAEAVKEMSWEEMQNLFAAIYVDELAELQRAGGGEKLMRERLGPHSGRRPWVCRSASRHGCQKLKLVLR